MYEQLIKEFPSSMRGTIKDLITDPELNEGVLMMLEREREFQHPLGAIMAGIALHPQARAYFDKEVEARSWSQEPTTAIVPEVIIGGGIHAATYAAVRRSKGAPRPTVIADGDAGGVFANGGPTFWLNSRNRPGDLAVPGRLDGGLNTMPGAVVQASDVSGYEYQSDADLAFAVRANLARDTTRIRDRVLDITPSYNTRSGFTGHFRLDLMSGARVKARRIIIATGLGRERKIRSSNGSGDGTMAFTEFMRHMGTEKFPLHNLGRIAVVGAGDSGKCAIEALCGIGPTQGMSVASLDWRPPQSIDWYLGGNIGYPLDRDNWCANNRGRYQRIGSVLGRQVNPIPRRVVTVQKGYDCFYLDGLPYDTVVICAGWTSTSFDGWTAGDNYASGGRFIARRMRCEGTLDRDANARVFKVGPAAEIEVDAAEYTQIPGASRNTANLVAAFRYTNRTATLAAELN